MVELIIVHEELRDEEQSAKAIACALNQLTRSQQAALQGPGVDGEDSSSQTSNDQGECTVCPPVRSRNHHLARDMRCGNKERLDKLYLYEGKDDQQFHSQRRVSQFI